MKNRSFVGLKTLQNSYLTVTKPIFHQIPSNSGNSEAGDVSEVSEPLGESWIK